MATKISLKQLSKEVLDLLNRGGGSLEKDITSNVTVGAAPANTKFPQGQTFTEFAEKILRKDITPNLSASFSNTGLHEIGTTVSEVTMTASIPNENQVTIPIKSLKFYTGTTLLADKPYIKGSTYSYVYSAPITTNTNFKIELVYDTNSIVSKSADITFVYATYYGVTNQSTINDTVATMLTNSFNKQILNKKGFTWNNIILNDERFCYMYPKSFGTLASIKDGNNFEQLQSYIRYEVNITSPINGDVVAYYAYLLTDSATGSGFKQTYA